MDSAVCDVCGMAHECPERPDICCDSGIRSCTCCFRKWNVRRSTEFGGIRYVDLYTAKLELGDVNLDVVQQARNYELEFSRRFSPVLKYTCY
jgi:hypothetical protein